jgi:FKBP-type peptidyl-prolyl cis-trans isomerase 2
MRLVGIVCLIAITLIFLGCVNVEEKKVEVGDNVKVNYTGKLEDGEIFDSSEGREPLKFVAGQGQMIKGFDEAVIGMKKGEKKTITLAPEEAYGEFREDAKITVDKNQLPNFENLVVGSQLMTNNGATGTIIEKSDQNAIIDFNHKLAGKTLIFDIEIVSIE